MMRTIVRRWPLSLFGSLNLAVAAALWAFSSAYENRAGVMLSLFIFIVLLASVLATHLVSQHIPDGCSWSREATLRTGENARAISLRSPSRIRLFPFVRLHLSLSGWLTSAGKRLYRISFECIVPEDADFASGLAVPASGEICLRGGYLVRDAFGLSRRRVGTAQELRAFVHPRASGELDVDVRETSSTASRSVIRKRSEGERIFLREYVSGDLSRDINWKALARTGALLTRVPPESPVDDRYVRLVVLLPPRGPDAAALARSLTELDHIRYLAASFFREARETAGDIGFSVRIGDGEHLVEPGASLDGILDALSASGFGSRSGTGSPEIHENAWVIASGSDESLAPLVPACVASGCEFFVSAARGVRDPDARRLPLLSSAPEALAHPVLALALLCPPGKGVPPGVTAFGCGVGL